MATFYSYKALETEEKEMRVLNGAFRLQKKDSQAKTRTRRQGVTPGIGVYLSASHLRSQSTVRTAKPTYRSDVIQEEREF
jgi:hypothetical protein